jgi:cell wall-associated NlpC family hydrolase
MLRAMQDPDASQERPGRKDGLRLAVGLAGLLWAASPGLAAPNPADDAVSKFLQDKGLIGAGANTGSTAAPATESTFVSQVRDRASDMVLMAMNFLGVPYRRGGTTSEDGFDCSGFTRYVFEMSLGRVLPRRADEQARAPGLLAIKRNELKPGDLVFFNTLKHAFSHVGIYVGDDKFIHSPRTGGEVRVEDMRLAYWAKRYNGARRADGLGADAGGDDAATRADAAASPSAAAERATHKAPSPSSRPR